MSKKIIAFVLIVLIIPIVTARPLALELEATPLTEIPTQLVAGEPIVCAYLLRGSELVEGELVLESDLEDVYFTIPELDISERGFLKLSIYKYINITVVIYGLAPQVAKPTELQMLKAKINVLSNVFQVDLKGPISVISAPREAFEAERKLREAQQAVRMLEEAGLQADDLRSELIEAERAFAAGRWTTVIDISSRVSAKVYDKLNAVLEEAKRAALTRLESLRPLLSPLIDAAGMIAEAEQQPSPSKTLECYREASRLLDTAIAFFFLILLLIAILIAIVVLSLRRRQRGPVLPPSR